MASSGSRIASSGSRIASSGSGSGGTLDKSHDYLLKILLVGDSDVGKSEILNLLPEEEPDSPFSTTSNPGCRTTMILLDGKRVKLQLWDTSGQGRFSTILRSYSRGAQGVLLVYDITNKWSFDSLARWLKEVEEHAPGIPKILVGNRCHLAHRRRVSLMEAELYATENSMGFFELSPLCDFNVRESFTELSRLALYRNGMDRLWRASKVLSLQELCCRSIVARTTVYGIDQLPLPSPLQDYLKSYAMCGYRTIDTSLVRRSASQRRHHTHHKHRHKIITPDTYRQPRSGNRNCVIL